MSYDKEEIVRYANKTSFETLERKVTEYLRFFAKDDYANDEVAPRIARISLEMNHLYQDLGFKNRFEMGCYMSEHFPRLNKIKPKDKLWKKFLYDSVGEIAPACETCSDQVDCFTCRT